MESASRASVSCDESSRGKTERCKPLRIFDVKMQRRGPDYLLVAQDVFEELPFE